MRICIALVLALALVVIGGWKLLVPPAPDALVAGGLAGVVGVLEVASGVLLVFAARLRVLFCCGVILLCATGIVVKLLAPHRTCGCVGSLSGGDYLIVIGILGTLASSYILLDRRSARD